MFVESGRSGRDDLLFYVRHDETADKDTVEVLRRDSKTLPRYVCMFNTCSRSLNKWKIVTLVLIASRWYWGVIGSYYMVICYESWLFCITMTSIYTYQCLRKHFLPAVLSCLKAKYVLHVHEKRV